MGGQDVAFQGSGEAGIADIAIASGDLVADDGLETAMLISLFSDRYVPVAELPGGVEDPRGWWADAISPIPEDRIGSRLWLLERGKITPQVKNQMKDYAVEALAWMISEGIAARIDVTTTIVQNERIELRVSIFRPNGQNIPFNFLWDGQELKKG